MDFPSPIREKSRKVSFKPNNRISNNVNSHVHSSESNDPSTNNSDNVTGSSNLPRIKVHDERSLNELVTFQKETDTESSNSINE